MTSKYQLVVHSGPTPGKVYELELESLTIGRDINNHIVINDPEISRKHARISLQSGGYVIEDMGSTNGTSVNDHRLLGPHMLKHGEIIALGDNVVLAFEELRFDPDATLLSTAGAPISPPAAESYRPPQKPPEPAPVYAPQPVYQQPAYGGLYPPGPEEPYAASLEPDIYAPDEPKKKSRTWLYLGCGCLLVLVCVLGGAAYAFDQLNLYCTPPFNLLFNCP